MYFVHGWTSNKSEIGSEQPFNRRGTKCSKSLKVHYHVKLNVINETWIKEKHQTNQITFKNQDICAVRGQIFMKKIPGCPTYENSCRYLIHNETNVFIHNVSKSTALSTVKSLSLDPEKRIYIILIIYIMFILCFSSSYFWDHFSEICIHLSSVEQWGDPVITVNIHSHMPPLKRMSYPWHNMYP